MFWTILINTYHLIVVEDVLKSINSTIFYYFWHSGRKAKNVFRVIQQILLSSINRVTPKLFFNLFLKVRTQKCLDMPLDL